MDLDIIKLFIFYSICVILQCLIIEKILLNNNLYIKILLLILLIFFYYANYSIVEWFVHKFLMHAPDNSFFNKSYKYFINDDHLFHHKITNANMKLLGTEKNVGLIKTSHVFSGIIINLIFQLIFLKLLNIEYNIYIIIYLIFPNLIFGFTLQYIWNIVHPAIHFETDIPDFIKKSYIFNYMAKKTYYSSFIKRYKKI